MSLFTSLRHGERPDWQHIKIIIVSARGMERDVERGLALGADDYVIKPFSNKELMEKIHKVCCI